MELHYVPVTDKNRNEILALHPAAGQESFLEPVSQCLCEADSRKCWRPVGIYDGNTLVGFAMYGFFRWEYFPRGRVWLDRLLIDERYQGHGYGKAALKGLVDRLISEYGRKKIYLSVIDGNETAVKMYEKFGFHFNGKKDIHGEKIMVYQQED